MRCQILWSDVRPTLSSNVPQISFSSDGRQLLTGEGNRLKVYEATSGAVVSAKALSKDVCAVAHAVNSGYTASGDAGGQGGLTSLGVKDSTHDSTPLRTVLMHRGTAPAVVVWDRHGQRVATYQHTRSVIALAFSSSTDQLASATTAEFAVWSPGDSPVKRQKVVDEASCLAWSHGGSVLAVATAGARISMHDSSGARLAQAPCRSAAIAMAWSPLREGEDERLVIGCADGSVSFFAASGSVIGHHVSLGSPITALAPFSSGEYLCIACASGRLGLHSRGGTFLGEVAEVESKVAHIRLEPRGTKICIVCEDGSLAMLQLSFLTVHGLYQDFYASREAMTRVAVQDMATGAQATVDCGALVHKVAVYSRRLAVQLSSQLLVYAVPPECPPGDVSLHMYARINACLPCNLLLVAAHHLLLCQDQKVQLLSLEGRQERSWATDTDIKYAQVIGGLPGCESALVGCVDGAVLQVFLAHPQPVHLLQHSCAIRCLDLSKDRSSLALVDERSCLHVYEAGSGTLLWSVEGATSAAWNSCLNGMLAWSEAEVLYTKITDHPVQRYPLLIQGAVVGFSMCKVYCLQDTTLHTYDVPLSATVRALLKRNDLHQAFQVASMGTTEKDWQALGRACLLALRPDLATAAYLRSRDARMLHACACLAQKKAQGQPDDHLHAYALALLGSYKEAGEAYCRAGASQDAWHMHTLLSQHAEAKAVGLYGVHHINNGVPLPSSTPAGGIMGIGDICVSAQSLARNNSISMAEYEAAADALLKVGDTRAALKLLSRHHCWQKLWNTSHTLHISKDPALIHELTTDLRQAGQSELAIQILSDLGETEMAGKLLVEAERWDEAFEVLSNSPEAVDCVLDAYIPWLLKQHRAQDAYRALREAGRHGQADVLTEDLAGSCAAECQYSEAASHMVQLAHDAFAAIAHHTSSTENGLEQKMLDTFLERLRWARIYSAQAVAHAMQSMASDGAAVATVFHALHFLVTHMLKENLGRLPHGVNLGEALISLAQAAAHLGLPHVADTALNHLQSTELPLQQQEEAIRCVQEICKEAQEDELLLLRPACFRCGCSGPLDFLQAEQCPECYASYVRSCASFECLPVLEIFLEDGITDLEASELLLHSQVEARQHTKRHDDNPRSLLSLVIGRDELRRLQPDQILIDSWENVPVRARYYRVMDAEFPLRMGRLGPEEADVADL